MIPRRLLSAMVAVAVSVANSSTTLSFEPPRDERFHLLVFTSQETVKTPRETHTWAVIVRSVGGTITETQSISWLPTDLRIKPLRLNVEPGSNFSFDDTIRWTASTTRQRISLWGPYEADPRLYARFVERKTQLESGAIGYQCLDFLGEAAARGNGVNCVHALAPIQGPIPVLSTQPYGDESGRWISQSLQRQGLIAPYSPTNDWLPTALGLNQASLERRSVPTTARLPYARPSTAAVN